MGWHPLRRAVCGVVRGELPCGRWLVTRDPTVEFVSLDRSRTPPPLEIASNDAAPGSGLGGPARYVARVRHCQVVGTDLTQELCDVATDLTHRVGLGDRVEIRQGDALALPFADGSFDVAWTQHVSMNIAGKAGMYAEMRRVVRAGGRLAFFDPLSGPEQPIRFPVPWAGDPASSALATVAETRDLVASAGFEIRTWDDLTADAVDFYASLAAGPLPTRTSACTCSSTTCPPKGQTSSERRGRSPHPHQVRRYRHLSPHALKRTSWSHLRIPLTPLHHRRSGPSATTALSPTADIGHLSEHSRAELCG